MTFNTDRAIEALAHIELAERGEHGPDRWEQSMWGSLESPVELPTISVMNEEREYEDVVELDSSTGLPVGTTACGTAFCMAGWVVHNEGIPLRWTLVDDTDGKWEYDGSVTIDGDDVSMVARDLLGTDNVGGLFHPSNNLSNLYAIVSTLSGEAVSVLKDRVAERMAAIKAKTPPGEGVHR